MEEARSSIVTRLDLNGLEFANSLSGVTFEEAQFRAAPDSWNILEYAGHVVKTEWQMTHFMNSADPLPEAFHRDEFELALNDPTRYRQRPLLSPAGSRLEARFRFPGEALDRFFEARNATRQYATSLSEEELRGRGGYHPLAGEVSCYECLLALIADASLCAEEILQLRRAFARSLA